MLTMLVLTVIGAKKQVQRNSQQRCRGAEMQVIVQVQVVIVRQVIVQVQVCRVQVQTCRGAEVQRF